MRSDVSFKVRAEDFDQACKLAPHAGRFIRSVQAHLQGRGFWWLVWWRLRAKVIGGNRLLNAWLRGWENPTGPMVNWLWETDLENQIFKLGREARRDEGNW